MKTEEMVKIIEQKYPGAYSEPRWRIILADIDRLDPEIRNTLEQSLIGEKMDHLEVEGYSIERLMKEHGMNIVAAALTLDWLKREPEKASQSLARGHDSIKI